MTTAVEHGRWRVGNRELLKIHTGEVIVTDENGSIAAVVVPWDDEDESPLEAIARLNTEAIELGEKLAQVVSDSEGSIKWGGH